VTWKPSSGEFSGKPGGEAGAFFALKVIGAEVGIKDTASEQPVDTLYVRTSIAAVLREIWTRPSWSDSTGLHDDLSAVGLLPGDLQLLTGVAVEPVRISYRDVVREGLRHLLLLGRRKR
jgi:hypothetical protein